MTLSLDEQALLLVFLIIVFVLAGVISAAVLMGLRFGQEE